MNKYIKKNNIKNSAIFALLFLTACFGTNCNVKAQQIRDMETNPVSIGDEYYEQQYDQTGEQAESDAEQETLYAIVGKSKLIKFDEPVKRMSITDPNLVDLVLLSPQEMLVNGKSSGVTSLIIWGSSGEPVFFDLVVKNDSESFLRAFKEIMPDERVDLKFTDTGIILAGEVSSSIAKDKISSLAEAYGFQLSDLSESPTPQVMLEVKVVEASRAFTRNISTTFSKSEIFDQFMSTNKITNLAGDVITNNAGAGFDGTLDGIKYFFAKEKHELGVLIKAGEQKGLIKVLAEPKLVAKNKEEASFNAGQQVPVPSGIGEGGNVSFEYKDVGVNVSFNPSIMEKSQRISLLVEPEVSEIDSTVTIEQTDGTTVYGFRTRKLSTTVELNNGETLILAGLIRRVDNTTKTQIPILGDLPIIGKFFGSSEDRKEDTELMIFVTPRILQPDNMYDGV